MDCFVALPEVPTFSRDPPEKATCQNLQDRSQSTLCGFWYHEIIFKRQQKIQNEISYKYILHLHT